MELFTFLGIQYIPPQQCYGDVENILNWFSRDIPPEILDKTVSVRHGRQADGTPHVQVHIGDTWYDWDRRRMMPVESWNFIVDSPDNVEILPSVFKQRPAEYDKWRLKYDSKNP